MKPLEIDFATLRDLIEQHPLYQIAQQYGCDVRRVGALVREYGLSAPFATRTATADEEAEILRLGDEGWSVRQIAIHLGRSQDFVSRRFHNVVDVPEPEDEDFDPSGWPEIETTPDDALRGRIYDDVGVDTLLRECPPGRLPLNGPALASAARWAMASQSRSAADLCVDA